MPKPKIHKFIEELDKELNNPTINLYAFSLEELVAWINLKLDKEYKISPHSVTKYIHGQKRATEETLDKIKELWDEFHLKRKAYFSDKVINGDKIGTRAGQFMISRIYKDFNDKQKVELEAKVEHTVDVKSITEIFKEAEKEDGEE